MRAWTQERDCPLSHRIKRCSMLYVRRIRLYCSISETVRTLALWDTASDVPQGDSGGTDKPKKPESTSSYNYRVVKEVTSFNLHESHIMLHFISFHLLTFCFAPYFLLRSCCGSAGCVSKKVCRVGRAGNSSRGFWGTWELMPWS